MRKITFYASLCICFLFTKICTAQKSFKNLQKDFAKLSGTWGGSLTYVDYSTGKPYTMPANLEIKRMGNANQFIFSNIYPNETNANSIDTLSISTDGKYINKELVKSRLTLPNGDIEIITEEVGEDGNDNKPATFKHTYTLGSTTYKKRKDVQFTGEKAWMNRHEYSYKKKPGRK